MPPCNIIHGRAFYDQIGSPKFILAPMVDQSEFAWRLLTRSFMTPETNKKLLCYTPMLHARMFAETSKFRDAHFQPLRSSLVHPPKICSDSAPPPPPEKPFLDGNPLFDRPLIVQFCANDPQHLLSAARYVSPFCDAVDLNLGCPQGIARKGHYGAFLQEDVPLICAMIKALHDHLPIPVTAKIRMLETKEKTLDYASRVAEAGASIITIHGRTRDMKGHQTGLADWSVIRYVREHLPHHVVVFANGNILTRGDIERCLEETGADAVMSAEGNLCDPGIFAEPPPKGQEGDMYWRDGTGRGGLEEREGPTRKPLYVPGRMDVYASPPVGLLAANPISLAIPDAHHPPTNANSEHIPNTNKRPLHACSPSSPSPLSKKAKNCKPPKITNPNLTPMQAHLFRLLRPLVATHTDIRDRLAKCRVGDMDDFEGVLGAVESCVEGALRAWVEGEEQNGDRGRSDDGVPDLVKEHKRPWWCVQPYLRPLPEEALRKGSWKLSKKEEKRQQIERMEAVGGDDDGGDRVDGKGEGGERELPKRDAVCG